MPNIAVEMQRFSFVKTNTAESAMEQMPVDKKKYTYFNNGKFLNSHFFLAVILNEDKIFTGMSTCQFFSFTIG